MKRSEQDIRFQWDLTKIYQDTAAWEAAMQEAEAALAPLAAIPGTLGTSKEAFKKGLDTVYASMFKVEMPYVYAFLKKTEDGSVAENQEMAARGESLIIKFNAAIAFLSPEILAIPAEKLDEWMQDEALATYRHTVDDIVRMRAHTLDAAREQMLALLGDAAGTPKAAFEMLTNVDLQLPMVKMRRARRYALPPVRSLSSARAATAPCARVRSAPCSAPTGSSATPLPRSMAAPSNSTPISPISAATPPRARLHWTAAMCPSLSMTV